MVRWLQGEQCTSKVQGKFNEFLVTVLMVTDVRVCNRPARINSFRPKELVCLQSRQPYANGTAKITTSRRGKMQQSDKKHSTDYTLSRASP